MGPTIGILSTARSTLSRNFSERLCASRKAKASANKAIRKMNHHFCSTSERLMTIMVKAGSSAPKAENTDWNWGTTLISRIAETTMATMITAIG
ncbi:hypothetical protein D3C76_1685340 [compost metagenome]